MQSTQQQLATKLQKIQAMMQERRYNILQHHSMTIKNMDAVDTTANTLTNADEEHRWELPGNYTVFTMVMVILPLR